jgi:hypothetical protein
MVSRSAMSSNDWSIVLKFCSLNPMVTKLACLKLHRVIFGVSRIILITGSQGLLNPLLTNHWVDLSQPHFGQVWGVKPNTSKVGDLESSETLECLEFDRKAQNTSHWGVLCVIGKVLKRRYRKWPCIGHLDICSPSYGQKKGRESNWQFDSRPLKVGNRPFLDIRFESATRRWKELDEGYNFGSDPVAIRLCSRELWGPKVSGLHPGQFRDSNLGVPGKRATSM